MEHNRTDILKGLLEQNPANTFARYGLAMELVKTADYDRAVGEFEELLSHDPDYAAAYYHGGQALEKSGKLEEARTFYERGIVACARVGDAHTKAEIEAALALL